MKQQTAYKLLAAFLVLTMIFSVFAYIFINPGSQTAQEPQNQSQPEKYNPAYWTINQPFYSIADALNMTPVGVVAATYTDLESMTPQMVQWARQDVTVINEADTIYNSTTTKAYYAALKEGKNNSFLLLSTMSPEKNDFEYIVYPQQIAGNYILVRQEPQLNGLYNVMGNPTILAPGETLAGVFQIITSLNKTATAYDQYAGLLSKAEPAPYQMLSSNVSFAKQYYMGIGLNNGSYERTTAYLDANSTTLNKLNQLKANSTEKGFTEYNITSGGNYTTVKIAGPDMFRVLSEETS
ncbi:Uncharacterised protein [uncultured archaeon]|nr:Uncharacterised protein [uncultured archaeon]